MAIYLVNLQPHQKVPHAMHDGTTYMSSTHMNCSHVHQYTFPNYQPPLTLLCCGVLSCGKSKIPNGFVVAM